MIFRPARLSTAAAAFRPQMVKRGGLSGSAASGRPAAAAAGLVELRRPRGTWAAESISEEQQEAPGTVWTEEV